jgi:undecaprenyl diphosphate synthase
MRYFKIYLKKELPGMQKRNIRFRFIGRKHPVPEDVLEQLSISEKETEGNTGLNFVLAINYGGRQEIIDGIKKFHKDVEDGKQSYDSLDEDSFGDYLYTAGLTDPDFLIRTSGEQRLSNFLLWQLSYTELYFPQKCWPDFKKKDFEAALEEFASRHRRFGGLEKKGALNAY